MIRAAVVLLFALPGPLSADDPPKFEPTADYEARTIEGWTVLVNKGFLARRPDRAERALTLLRSQLGQVARAVPAKAVESLRAVKFWLEEDEPHHPCMTYHPDVRWLVDHGMNPEKARCVEISNAEKFLEWSREQTWMALHELAHAYHDRVLEAGFENKGLEAAYDRAMKGGFYRSVLRLGGARGKAYAATNRMEYFAEGTEAYFGRNEFYPFTRAELARHDPGLHTLLGRLWGVEVAKKKNGGPSITGTPGDFGTSGRPPDLAWSRAGPGEFAGGSIDSRKM